MVSARRAVLAAVGSLVFAGAAFVAPSAIASPGPESPDQCYDLKGNGIDCSVGPTGIVVNTENGVRAGVRVGDLLCVRAEAVSERTTADARVRIPCPVNHYPVFKNCDQARAAGAHDIPKGSPLYRKGLDDDGDGVACETAPVVTAPGPVKEAPAPEVVESHLPVTH